jgi:hypothetical protein
MRTNWKIAKVMKMTILKDILATSAGIGPNHKTQHQNIRNLLRLDSDEYAKTWSSIVDMYHTFPALDYGSTIEGDYRIAEMFGNAAPGSSLADQWINIAVPQAKKPRLDREGNKAYQATPAPLKSLFGRRAGDGPQILYNYYENGTLPGPRLAVLIVDKMGDNGEYGTKMSNVKFGFKAKLKDWDETKGEYQNIELTHLYIDGQYQPMSAQATEASMLYAEKLTAMMFEDDGQQYDPQKAMKEVLDIHGEDVFKVSTWSARRNSTYKAATPS